MVVGEHEIQIFEVVVVELLFLMCMLDVFVPKTSQPLLIMEEWFVQIYLNIDLYKSLEMIPMACSKGSF